eukprot:1141558-Rhodomonas_salina.1
MLDTVKTQSPFPQPVFLPPLLQMATFSIHGHISCGSFTAPAPPQPLSVLPKHQLVQEQVGWRRGWGDLGQPTGSTLAKSGPPPRLQELT